MESPYSPLPESLLVLTLLRIYASAVSSSSSSSSSRPTTTGIVSRREGPNGENAVVSMASFRHLQRRVCSSPIFHRHRRRISPQALLLLRAAAATASLPLLTPTAATAAAAANCATNCCPCWSSSWTGSSSSSSGQRGGKPIHGRQTPAGLGDRIDGNPTLLIETNDGSSDPLLPQVNSETLRRSVLDLKAAVLTGTSVRDPPSAALLLYSTSTRFPVVVRRVLWSDLPATLVVAHCLRSVRASGDDSNGNNGTPTGRSHTTAHDAAPPLPPPAFLGCIACDYLESNAASQDPSLLAHYRDVLWKHAGEVADSPLLTVATLGCLLPCLSTTTSPSASAADPPPAQAAAAGDNNAGAGAGGDGESGGRPPSAPPRGSPILTSPACLDAALPPTLPSRSALISALLSATTIR
eukprot:GHVU01047854.1.p1 GENE.GHVU01047854.1~~GHVU01047854.1.p1  ORF type:complete len:438 (+),score=71.08 GHVU01047854.1:87-1316(+)